MAATQLGECVQSYLVCNVDVVLESGEASLHHGHLFHASGPNGTDRRRIGAAIRYITPSMQQQTGDRLLVAHVSGEDRYR